MSKGVIDYKIRCVTPSQYELRLVYHAQGRMLNLIFNKSKEKMQKKLGQEIQGDPSKVDSFDIPPNYLKLLCTVIRSNLRSVYRIFKKDKIVIMDEEIMSAKFIKDSGGDWNIHILLTGSYADKR